MKGPTFINVCMVIGLGSALVGNTVANGTAFGPKDVEDMNRTYGFDLEVSGPH
jgi:hypothetical protein